MFYDLWEVLKRDDFCAGRSETPENSEYIKVLSVPKFCVDASPSGDCHCGARSETFYE
jgi:hypothetical protein